MAAQTDPPDDKIKDKDKKDLTNVDTLNQIVLVEEVTLPKKDNQQKYVIQAYSASGNSVYVSFYGQSGAVIKISDSKVTNVIQALDKTKFGLGTTPSQNITIHVSSNSYTVRGTGVNGTPSVTRETLKYARINFNKQVILIFEKDYEYKPPSVDRSLTKDYGVLVTFDQFKNAHSFIETKEGKLRLISTGSTVIDNDI